jgi:hypothetical protein
MKNVKIYYTLTSIEIEFFTNFIEQFKNQNYVNSTII